MAKTALVIGGAGFVGTGVVQELLRAGWDVASLGRGNKRSTLKDVKFIAADRNAPGALREAIGEQRFDLVVDCAAFRHAEAVTAVEALDGRVGHYVFISTDFVYSSPPDLVYPINEESPKHTTYPYGAGKLECEAVLWKAWKERKFPATALRPPHVMGHGRVLGCDLVQIRDPRVLDYIRKGEGTILVADGQLLVQPVWHREIGRAIAHIAGNGNTFGQVFNIMGPDCVATRYYYELIARYFNMPLRYKSVSMAEAIALKPDAAPVLRHRVYDTTRLKTTGGYTPSMRLEDAIAETIEWMLAQPA